MNELNARMQRFSGDFPNRFTAWLDAVLAAQALAMIDKRVRTTGVGPDGTKYKPYSSSPTLIGAKSFTKKVAADAVFSSKDKRRAMEWFTVGGHHLALLPGGYRRIREIEGRQVAFKDFDRTSQMWTSIRVLGTRQTGQGFATTIGTLNEFSEMKLSANVDREGKEILMTTKQEEAELTEMLDKYITNSKSSRLT